MNKIHQNTPVVNQIAPKSTGDQATHTTTTQAGPSSHKQAYVNRVSKNFPSELQAVDQWVVWKYVPDPGKPKPRKLLFNPHNGKAADSTDTSTWGTFAEAISAYLSGDYEGLGFVFSEDDPYCGVDLDNCIEGGEIEGKRGEWMRLLDSYSEKSPSSKGIHTFVRGVLPPEGRKNPALGVEMYDSERYFTVTGDHITSTPKTVHSRQKQLLALHREFFPKHYQQPSVQPSAQLSADIPQDDNKLWDILFDTKNGEAIRSLFNGNLSGHSDDHSGADLALCNHLAWATGKDSARIDRMFRQSRLMRSKWERADYRKRTIDAAIAATTSTYDPNYRSSGNNNSASSDAKQRTEHGTSYGTTSDKTPQDSVKPKKRSDHIKSLLSNNGWRFRLNILDNAVEVNGQRMSDIDESLIVTYVRDVMPHKARASKEEVRDIINVLAHENQYHPIREYLDSLVWDGKNHIAELSRYFKDKHEEITYSDGKKQRVFPVFFGKWLISVVAKAFETGTVTAQSPMLVLSAAQDMGKSTFVRHLASGMISYYNESDIKPDSEDHKRLLATKWIWEVGELGATTRKADVESLKHFLTMADVTFRVPYGRYHLRKPALASFVGTVNPDVVRSGFLSDNTGNRRFLTVELRSINQDYEKNINPNQLWAQAVALYKQGAEWRLNDVERAMRDRINNKNMIQEPISDWLFKFFDIDPSKDSWRTSVPDIVSLLQTHVKDTSKSIQMSVSKVLLSEGLRRDETVRPIEWIGVKPK